VSRTVKQFLPGAAFGILAGLVLSADAGTRAENLACVL